ncbi:cell division protein ZapA [Pelomicrobium methylotrophicum]|uniref:Cell division protein ZapA n=1 Tax=Pelomicrobium methylotrophicum TaxID=2602750 RepID=A0A5C7F0S8_9PROT|nr:cell division protein ZapA [Pelomicrobium methylotrophicum]TXF13314.1 cell division protein ZapA [Pelomicrobium methylotrophicum]
MSAELKALDVSIMGREFRVACKEEERQQLLDAVAFLEKRMREVKESGKVVGTERVALIAALQIAHEFLSTRVSGGFDLGEFRRRIATMQETIDRALSEQDELF